MKINMCIGCGMCGLACSKNAIIFFFNKARGNFEPTIIKSKCINCGECLDICFGHNIDYIHENNLTLSNTLGKSINSYLGYSTDKNFRFESSSGGVIPSILEYLFDKKLINGAIVTQTKSGKIPLAYTKIINNKKMIKESIGSKYCPVFFSEALTKFRKDGIYAVIGLPCQIFSIQKLINKNKLRGNVFVFIGLLCGGVPNYNGTKYLMKRSKLNNEYVKKIQYRGNGWPGKLIIVTKLQTITLPFPDYWPLISPWFRLNRCELCLSGLSIKTDISCGDAWLESIMKKDPQGTSVFVSRTKSGDDLLKKIINEGYIKAHPIKYRKFLESQKMMINNKHYRFSTRLKISKILGKKTLFDKFERDKNYPKIIYNRYIIEEFWLLIGKFLANKEKIWFLFDIFILFSNIIIEFLGLLKNFKLYDSKQALKRVE